MQMSYIAFKIRYNVLIADLEEKKPEPKPNFNRFFLQPCSTSPQFLINVKLVVLHNLANRGGKHYFETIRDVAKILI